MPYQDLENTIRSYSVFAVIIGLITLLVLIIFSLSIKKLTSSMKKILFIAIILAVLLPTFFLAGS